MGQIQSIFLTLLFGFLLLASCMLFIFNLGTSYAPTTNSEDLSFTSMRNQVLNISGQMSNTTQSEEISSGDVLGVPAFASINVLTAAKYVFAMLNVFDNLVNSMLQATGIPVLMALKLYLIAAFGVVVLFGFMRMILRIDP